MEKYFLGIMLMLLAGCAHSPANLTSDWLAAEKQCAAQKWPTEVAKANCYDSQDGAVIKRDSPILLDAFDDFSSKHATIAETFDEEIAPAKEHMNRYLQSENEAKAVLIAHEPQFAASNSQLSKDIVATKAAYVCKSKSAVAFDKCLHSIGQPIWEKDAPDTLQYYEEFEKKRLQAAKIYDASDSPKLYTTANTKFVNSLKEAQEAFFTEAKQIINQQQVANNNQQLQQSQNTANALATYAAIKALMPQPVPVQPYMMPIAQPAAPAYVLQQQQQINETKLVPPSQPDFAPKNLPTQQVCVLNGVANRLICY